MFMLSSRAPLRGPVQSRSSSGARGQQQQQLSTLRSKSSKNVALRTLKVAAIDQPATYQPDESRGGLSGGAEAVDPELNEQLALQQLDAAQEDLLKWMLFLDSDQQEADLDEAVDQEEVGDEEFEALYDDVETMLEDSGATFKVGDKVYGTVYEVDEDGAYVEIGAKTAGFVPLAECSLGKLKTVSASNSGQQAGQWAAWRRARRSMRGVCGRRAARACAAFALLHSTRNSARPHVS